MIISPIAGFGIVARQFGGRLLWKAMGRDCSALALMAAAVTGAEYSLIPEGKSPSLSDIAIIVTTAYMRAKPNCVVAVAKG
jgi:6-phosphofructokinase